MTALSFLHEQVLQGTSEIWALFALEGNLVEAGASFDRRLGYGPDRRVGLALESILHPDEKEDVLRQVAHLVPYKGSAIRCEFRLRHAQGTWLNVEAVLTHVAGNGTSGILLQAQDVTRFKIAEEALRFAEEKYRGIFENAVEGIYQASPDGRFLSANPSLARILGFESPVHLIHSVRDMGIDVYVDPAAYRQFRETVEREGAVKDFEAKVRRRDGTEIWVSGNAHSVKSPAGKLLFLEGTVEDVTTRRLAQDGLRRSEERYALAASGSNGGLWEWDIPKERMFYSPRWAQIMGMRENDLKGSPQEWFDRVHPRDSDLLQQEIRSHLSGQVPHFECEFRILHSDNSYRWVLSRGMARMGPDGKPERMAGSLEDITSRKRAEEQLMQGALYDALTGLPNRALFLDRLRRAIQRAQKSVAGQYVGVLHLDIDRFKLINDSLGHEAGDELILAVGRALEESLQSRDTLSRLGGDEFAILMEGYQDLNVFSRMAERIVQRLAQPIRVRNQEVFVSLSIGIAVSERLQDHPEDLLRDAETAMYRAKSQGKGRHVVFNQGMHEFAAAHLQLETSLRRAVEREEFRVYYQPILDISSGRVAGFESLVRWQNPEKGLVNPAVFIPLAEETGLIVEIGRQVLRESCRQFVAWRGAVDAAQKLFVSVNLSVRQFALPDIVDQVRTILFETGFPGECLKLEITESVILENTSIASEKLNALRALGVQLSIDDFGTGYSSLSYLHQYPFDNLKIDRSFVSRMAEAPERSAIVRTIVQLARSLGMDAVAEGIETPAQLAGLKAMNCRYGQGFLFSKPVPAVEAERLLDAVYSFPAEG
ncbi:MAG TPA: EAL domain-containing protein [Fibrobacteria bacterium]|nr:EAL domain-containing protein [Fibrobacteria bacterium]HOX50621.1 EAL domain-containing protein [Fibrobacteria bacterium]